MAKIIWDQTGERFYETGVKNCVLYPQSAAEYPKGYAWNGITSVNENPSGAESTDLWADDQKYATLRSAEAFGGTIEAYTYPPEFEECDGTKEVATGIKIGQQSRKPFGLCYRTAIGSDTLSDASEYKLHLVYGATASPSEKSYSTINDSPDAITFSWEFETVPVNVTGHNATSLMTIDSRTANKEKLASLMEILYGTDENEARLPLPDEVITLFGPVG